MKILFLVPYAPTPIRTRPYNLIRVLAQRGHSLTLAACWENQVEKYVLEGFSGNGIHVISEPLSRSRIMLNLARAFFSNQPLQSHYSWHPNLARLSGEALREGKFDVVHVEHIRGARYAQYFKTTRGENNRQHLIVWDSVDCISHLFEQASKYSRNIFGKWISRLELGKTKKLEATLISQFERILVTSPVDAIALEKLAGNGARAPISILPNGVDLEYFYADETPRSRNVILFSGKLSYHANVTAALHLVHEIMPLVWVHRPEVLVQLAGKDPHPALVALAKSDPRIRVTGTVPDLRPYLRQAAISVAPVIYGAGIQNKVLEAMACETPVVATPLAVSGLTGVSSGKELLVAQGISEFSEAILALLSDHELSLRLGKQGARFIQQNYSWEGVVGKLEGIYRESIEEPELNIYRASGVIS